MNLVASHHWMREEVLERSLERLVHCGYDAVVLLLDEPHRDPSVVRPALERFGLRCHGVVALAGPGKDLASPDPVARSKGRDELASCLDFCAELGGAAVPVVPRPVGLLQPTAAPAREWAWLRDGLAQGSRLAGQRGLRLGVEALNRFEGYLFNTCADVLAMADEIEEPAFGVVLDAFHMNIEEQDLAAAVLNAGDRLIDFQVADSNRAAPGRGHIDWPSLAAALDAIDYQGALTAEIVPPVLAPEAKAGRLHGDAPPRSASAVDEAEFVEQLAQTAVFLRHLGSGLTGGP